MQRHKTAILLIVALLTLPLTASANTRTFRIARDSGSRATFVSNATLEKITGLSTQVTGSIELDPSNLATAKGRIELPVSSLRTGIELRDEHLKNDKWLHAKKYPTIVFEIVKVEGAGKLTPGKAATLKIRGKLTVRGKTKPITAEAKAKLTGNTLRGRARFKIELADFDISVPATVRLKVANELSITVDIKATAD